MKRRLGALAATTVVGLFVGHEIKQNIQTNKQSALQEQLSKPITEVHDQLMTGKIDADKIRVVDAPITASPDAEAAAINPDAYKRQGMSAEISAQEGPVVHGGDPLVLDRNQVPQK